MQPKEMAGVEGLEPPTLGLEIRCSILLSYTPSITYADLRSLVAVLMAVLDSILATFPASNPTSLSTASACIAGAKCAYRMVMAML